MKNYLKSNRYHTAKHTLSTIFQNFLITANIPRNNIILLHKIKNCLRLEPSINLIKRVVYWFNELAILVEKIIKKTDRIISWL